MASEPKEGMRILRRMALRGIPGIKGPDPMVFLIEHTDIDQVKAKGQRDGFYLLNGLMRRVRASKVGESCDASVYMNMLGMDEPPTTKGLRIMEIGTMTEPMVARWMREDGWEVRHNDRDQFGVLYAFTGGILTGHYDVVCRHPVHTLNEWILGDVKTMSPDNFSAWSRMGTKVKMPYYYDQIIVYAVPMNLSKCAIIGMDKSGADYKVEIMPVDRGHYRKMVSRTARLLASHATPLPDKAAPGLKCNFCHVKKACMRLQGIANAGSVPDEFMTDRPGLRAPKDMLDVLASVYELRDEAGHAVIPGASLEDVLLPTGVFDRLLAGYGERAEEAGEFVAEPVGIPEKTDAGVVRAGRAEAQVRGPMVQNRFDFDGPGR